MNIELDEGVVQDISDDALELVAGVVLGAGAVRNSYYYRTSCCAFELVLEGSPDALGR